MLCGWHAVQVGRFHPIGQGKARAFDAGIHRPDNRRVASRFGAAQQLQAVGAVGLQIQLKPARCTLAHFCFSGLACLGNVFQRATRQGAHHHASLQGHGCAHGGDFALWVHQTLVSHRCEQDGAGQRVPQQFSARVGTLHIRQRTGQQPQVIERRAVVRQRQILVGSTLDVPPRLCLDVVDGMALVIGRAGNVRRNLAVCRAQGLTQSVDYSDAHQASDHMRSRLW